MGRLPLRLLKEHSTHVLYFIPTQIRHDDDDDNVDISESQNLLRLEGVGRRGERGMAANPKWMHALRPEDTDECLSDECPQLPPVIQLTKLNDVSN